MLQQRSWFYWEKIAVADDVAKEEVLDIGKRIVRNFFLEVLVHGSVGSEEAVNLIKQNVLAILPKEHQAPLPHQIVPLRVAKLPDMMTYIYAPSPLPNPNSAVELYFQIGSLGDITGRVCSQLVAQIFTEPFFDSLRTNEHLGYLVSHFTREKCGTIGLRFTIQSEKDPIFLDNRIERFISGMVNHLEQLSDIEYTMHLNSLKANLLAKKKRLGQETTLYWGQIQTQNFDFERQFQDAISLSDVKKSDLIVFVRERLLVNGKKRRKMAVHIWSENFKNDQMQLYEEFFKGNLSNVCQDSSNVVMIHNPSHFVQQLDLFPASYSTKYDKVMDFDKPADLNDRLFSESQISADSSVSVQNIFAVSAVNMHG